MTLNDKENLKQRLCQVFSNYFSELNISKSEIRAAVDAARDEELAFKADIRHAGEEAVKKIEKENLKGIVLAGRPYHLDPEINHGMPELINSLDMAVLTEDSVCHLAQVQRPLRVVDQWVYHSRLYKAAEFTKKYDNIELVQLNSFGCGLDAVTTEQVQEILAEKSKIYTVIKIDEGNNLGAAKIRLRSLKAAMAEREANNISVKNIKENKIHYTKNDKFDPKRKLLVPQMSPIHFQFIQKAVNLSGWNVEILQDTSREIIEEGLRYVNNDACYPAIIVIGQLIGALKSGTYDLNNVAVGITQTGGGCRATNYIGFLRKAMYEAGFKDVPVVSLSAQGIEDNGLKENISLPLLNRGFMAVVYGDLFMKVLYRTRPYEKVKGSANALYEKWVKICMDSLESAKFSTFSKNIKAIIKDFDNLELLDIKKPRVGLVGEILVKFHPTANNNIVDVLEREGAEAVMPELAGFFLYCSLNNIYKKDHKLEGSAKGKFFAKFFIGLVSFYQKTYVKELKKSKRFTPPESIYELAEKTKTLVSIGNQTGEGWFLPGEMIELIESGVDNIVCMQPFGCLPNHIIGKGPIKELKARYPKANIIPIDYDPSASEVNQINRIKLMLSRAFKNLKEEDNTSKISSKAKTFTVNDIKSNKESESKTPENKKAVNM